MLTAEEIRISIPRQTLTVQMSDGSVRQYPVSTASNGAGEANGSGCTPRGQHYIRARIGAGQPRGSVFVGRRPTGEIYSSQLAAEHPSRDWILTRILWLCGKEPRFNRGGDVDSMRRYIYIHGTPDTEPMGVPASHGCVRMRNDDLLELFDGIPAGTPVFIE